MRKSFEKRVRKAARSGSDEQIEIKQYDCNHDTKKATQHNTVKHG